MSDKLTNLNALEEHPGWKLFMAELQRQIEAQRNKLDDAYMNSKSDANDRNVHVLAGFLKGLRSVPAVLNAARVHATAETTHVIQEIMDTPTPKDVDPYD